jgi:hypothetical protein
MVFLHYTTPDRHDRRCNVEGKQCLCQSHNFATHARPFGLLCFEAMFAHTRACQFNLSVLHDTYIACTHALLFNEYSLFLELRLAFVFCLDFCSDLVISLYQAVFRPLVYIGFHQKSCFKKVWMVLEKRKKFHDYSGTNGSLFRLWLIFCMSCLMLFL